jgi:MFS family permease
LLLAGIARGIGGIALSATMMEIIPKHYMGRVQNLFNLFAIGIQIMVAPLVGGAAQKSGLVLGTAVIGTMYLLATVAGLVASKTRAADADLEVAATAKTGAA